MAKHEIKDTLAIIMMAGKGTRMKSDRPKVLHEICGVPMGRWVIDSCEVMGITNRVIVVGHKADEVRAAFPDETFTLQKPQNGTGHAVMVGMKKVPKSAKNVLVLSGDVPCMPPSTLYSALEIHNKIKSFATVLTFEPPDPMGYGRIIRGEKGRFLGIVEEKDLNDEQQSITECNSGIYIFDRTELAKALKEIKPNKKSGEYHLPDAIIHMLKSGPSVEGLLVNEWIQAMGVNSRMELSEAGEYLSWKINMMHMEGGVTIIDPASTLIGPYVQIGKDTTIQPGTIMMDKVSIGSGCVIGPHTEIRNAEIGNECTIRHSVLTECLVDDGVNIGPFAHIRPGTRIRKGAKVGNFVEMKNVDFGEGSKCGHLTYLGDAKVGKNANIGAGTITCNYDGRNKHKTVIGDDVFLGSDSILVAPIRIGKGAYTAAGSTLTRDVPPHSLAFGRAKQINRKNWVKNNKK